LVPPGEIGTLYVFAEDSTSRLRKTCVGLSESPRFVEFQKEVRDLLSLSEYADGLGLQSGELKLRARERAQSRALELMARRRALVARHCGARGPRVRERQRDGKSLNEISNEVTGK
jgi:hypothetical protein